MHDQCNTRPIVTFSVAKHHCPLAGTKLQGGPEKKWHKVYGTTFRHWPLLCKQFISEYFAENHTSL